MFALTADEKRLVSSDYFLKEDNFGKVHGQGARKIQVARVTRDYLVIDSRFRLDCNTAFLPGRRFRTGLRSVAPSGGGLSDVGEEEVVGAATILTRLTGNALAATRTREAQDDCTQYNAMRLNSPKKYDQGEVA